METLNGWKWSSIPPPARRSCSRPTLSRTWTDRSRRGSGCRTCRPNPGHASPTEHRHLETFRGSRTSEGAAGPVGCAHRPSTSAAALEEPAPLLSKRADDRSTAERDSSSYPSWGVGPGLSKMPAGPAAPRVARMVLAIGRLRTHGLPGPSTSTGDMPATAPASPPPPTSPPAATGPRSKDAGPPPCGSTPDRPCSPSTGSATCRYRPRLSHQQPQLGHQRRRDLDLTQIAPVPHGLGNDIGVAGVGLGLTAVGGGHLVGGSTGHVVHLLTVRCQQRQQQPATARTWSR